MKTLKPKSSFSKSHLGVFLIIFAVIGLLILIKSLAAPNPNLPGDLNNDNNVSVTDLSIILSNYGTTNNAADINSDGSVNVLDLSILLSHYGQSFNGDVQIPASIASDCSTDVTSALISWMNSVPDNSTLQFGSGKCYRVEGTIDLSNRSGLVFDGNNSTFKSLNPMTSGNSADDQRAMWRIWGSTSITIQDMTLIGAYIHGGTHDPTLQHAHAIDLRGTTAEISNIQMSQLAGDCVYYGLGSNNTTRSSGSFHDSTCSSIGRNAVSLVAADNVTVQRVTTGTIGYEAFDVEPNAGPGFGDCHDTFDSNIIGTSALHAYSVVETAPICNQSFTNNHITSPAGLKISIGDPLNKGFHPNGILISGNHADNPATPTPINADNVDNLTITNNTIPMTAAGYMTAVTNSCKVVVSGNSYPGGGDELYQTTPRTGC